MIILYINGRIICMFLRENKWCRDNIVCAENKVYIITICAAFVCFLSIPTVFVRYRLHVNQTFVYFSTRSYYLPVPYITASWSGSTFHLPSWTFSLFYTFRSLRMCFFYYPRVTRPVHILLFFTHIQRIRSIYFKKIKTLQEHW